MAAFPADGPAASEPSGVEVARGATNGGSGAPDRNTNALTSARNRQAEGAIQKSRGAAGQERHGRAVRSDMVAHRSRDQPPDRTDSTARSDGCLGSSDRLH